MRRIRLVATDVDGTLLDPQGCLTPRTRAAIQAAIASGVTLALATARRWTGASHAAAQFDFRGHVIIFDGAMIRSYPDGEVLSAAPLDRVIAQRAADAMLDYGLQPIMQFCDRHAEVLRVAEEAPYPAWTAEYLDIFRGQIQFCPAAELCDVAADPMRLVAFAPISALRRAAVDLRSPECGRQLLLTGNFGMAELTLFSSAASKGNALVTLARTLDIALDETMAVGDGLNDISMLRAAGLGVAMGHASRRVRASANVVTGSNAEDGLAQALENFVLGEQTGATSIAGAEELEV
jgi:hydroxymethylpyrimidine pyrophosphatase-like HAD family hydrolase